MPPSPLLGYNTNVRHRGKIFHIQTEDSGVAHAHIFTHLFADGGRIIATKKTTYAQYVGTDRFPAIVKKLMQAQHKAMFIALRDGLFDEDEVAGAKAFSERQIVLEEDATQPTEVPQPGAAAPAPAAPASSASAPAVPASAAPAATSPAATSPAATSPAAPRSAEVDVAALERAAAAFSGSYVPPVEPPAAPPATPVPQVGSRPAPARASTPAQPQRAVHDTPSRPLYQPTQPAAARPRVSKPVESLFGADILSEKSLDEVIMSYLAEDLDDKD